MGWRAMASRPASTGPAMLSRASCQTSVQEETVIIVSPTTVMKLRTAAATPAISGLKRLPLLRMIIPAAVPPIRVIRVTRMTLVESFSLKPRMKMSIRALRAVLTLRPARTESSAVKSSTASRSGIKYRFSIRAAALKISVPPMTRQRMSILLTSRVSPTEIWDSTR